MPVRDTPTRQLDCSFVKRVPLPIPTQKGVPIQARVLSAQHGKTESVYNPRTPSRAEVRQENYKRRLMQWTSQGFRALNYKPYQGIGDPFYLDHKKLILHALGQWDENNVEKVEAPTSSDDDRDSGPISKPISPAKFVFKRSDKEINTLPKELNKGRNMVRNIRHGHSLFIKLREHHEEKMTRESREQQAKLELKRTQWQPPNYDSSSSDDEDLDEDLKEEVDLRMYMRGEEERLSPQPTEGGRTEGTHSRIVFSVLDNELEEKANRIKSAPASAKSRKKSAKFSRPYTPQHVNISSRFSQSTPKATSRSELIQAEPLFKQLCCLHWLLEAMEINRKPMMPILESWNLKSKTGIGGMRKTNELLNNEAKAQHGWDEMMTKGVPLNVKGKKSPRRGFNVPTRKNSRTRSTLVSMRGSSEDAASALGDNEDHSSTGVPGTRPSSVASNVEDPNPSPTLNVKDQRGNSISIIEENEEGEALHEAEQNSENDTNEKVTKFSEFESYFKDVEDATAKLDKTLKKELNRAKVTKQLDNLLHEEALQERRELLNKRTTEHRNSIKKLRADFHLIRSKSSPSVVEFTGNAKSNTKCSLANDLRQSFYDVKEESQLILHDKLEISDRQKQRRCKQKFSAVATEGFSYHRAVAKMRNVIEEERKRLESMQQKAMAEYEEWMMDIEVNIPAQLQELWYYSIIIQKLRRFGLVESAKQADRKRFLLVLNTLRPWEICSPDVSAAVEFCRDRIINMSIADYEKWFQDSFPQVLRPKTAPPSVQGKR